MAGDVERSPPAGDVLADLLEAARRQPAELDGEEDDPHQAEPEGWRRVEDEPERRDQRVRPPLGPPRREHAERRPGREGEGERRPHEEESHREPLPDHGRDGLPVDRRLPEVELDQPAEIADELHRHGDVEAVKAPELARRVRIAAAHLRHHGVHRISRRELEEQEQPDQDEEERRQAGGQPPEREEEDGHRLACIEAWSLRASARGGWRRYCPPYVIGSGAKRPRAREPWVASSAEPPRDEGTAYPAIQVS